MAEKILAIAALVIAVFAILFSITEDEQLVYAEGHFLNSSGYTISLPAAETYTNFTEFHIEKGKAISLTTGKATIIETGYYKIDFGLSFSGGANNKYGFGIAVNNVDPEDIGTCYAQRSTGSTGVGNAGTTCILYLNKGDYLNFQIEDEAIPKSDPVIYILTIDLLKIGD